jgi:hypothetical protein
MKVLRGDTETNLIRPGLLAPELVWFQRALDIDGDAPLNGDVRIDNHLTCRAEIEQHLLDPDVLWEFFNHSFDGVVICQQWPELTPLYFKMLADMRGRDPLLRQKLLQIRYGTMPDAAPKGYWSLAGIVKRRLGIELDKGEDTYRTKYALLRGKPIEEAPPEAITYGKGDVTVLRRLSRDQNKDAYNPPDEWLQVAASFCLQLAATWGLRVDEWRLGWTKMCLLNDEKLCTDVLNDAGFFRDGKVNNAAIQAAVEAACKRAGQPVPKTAPSSRHPEGQTKKDAETCEALAPHDDRLTALSRHNTNTKMLSTYLEPMEFGTKFAMTSRPNALVGTGRTSWGGAKHKEENPWWPALAPGEKYITNDIKVGTNLQNWPQAVGIRECIRPRPGYYLCSVDYNSLELRTLGQACLWLLGKSTFADGYRNDPDWDPHSYFGGQLIGIDYAAALKRKKTDPSFKTGPRTVGKATNFSLPGGVGPRRMEQMFAQLFEAGELPQRYTLDQCRDIKDAWLCAYPEMPEYFELANWHAETGAPVQQLVSNRLRGKLTYSAAANTWFQGLAADLAKRALFYIQMSCYCKPSSPLWGSRLVAFIHDEFLLEVPIELAHEAAFEVVRLMVLAANEVCPDVPFAAEPALGTYWTKWLDPKYDAAGRLIPWD